MGAYDFIEKPLSLEKIILTVNNALGMQRLRQENASLRDMVLQEYEVVGVVPADRKAARADQPCCSDRYAGADLREKTAPAKNCLPGQYICRVPAGDNRLSKSTAQRFPRNLSSTSCSGMKKELLLVPAARRRGDSTWPTGGTIFLEEVGDLSLKTQAKLLRILEERKIRAHRRHQNHRGRCPGRCRQQQETGGGGQGREASGRISFTGLTLSP